LGRRERDAYRHSLSVYADKILHGEIEGLKLEPVKMPLDKYLALLDFLELDLYDLMSPPPFNPDDVDVVGLNPEQASAKIAGAKAASDRTRQDLFFIFDNLSRGRQLGWTDRIDFQQNFFHFLQVIGHLGKSIEKWAELQPMTEEEIQDATHELELQGRTMPLGLPGT
jgi:hypothetical protein